MTESTKVKVHTPTLSRTVMISDKQEVIDFLIEEIQKRDEILKRIEEDKDNNEKT